MPMHDLHIFVTICFMDSLFLDHLALAGVTFCGETKVFVMQWREAASVGCMSRLHR